MKKEVTGSLFLAWTWFIHVLGLVGSNLIEIGCMQAVFRNLQNYAGKAVKLCSKTANYAEKMVVQC